jgi:hypothetical protein
MSPFAANFQHDSNYMGLEIPDFVWRERMAPTTRQICVLNTVHFKVDCLAHLVLNTFDHLKQVTEDIAIAMRMGVDNKDEGAGNVHIPEDAHVRSPTRLLFVRQKCNTNSSNYAG